SKHRGDKAMMLDYGEQYMRITDSLNMGKRQELAATANNQYQYYKDIEEIQQTIREKDRYRLWTFGTLSVLVLVVSSSLVAYYYKKNKYLQRAMSLSGHLKATKEENATLTKELERRRAEIDAAHKALLGMRAQAERLREETARYEAVIREQEQQLAKRDEQNERYRLMLTKTHLEDTARNVMENVRMAAGGKHDMTEDDWTALQLSIDGMHPTFSDEIKKAVGTCNEQQRRVYYLLRAGLTARQIQAILPVPRSTLWRWIKRLSETHPDIVHIEE
ncbi:MAG: helix-turn-helix domain-containing protein, partial [Bacteroidales bacterium]|nr:helix-turn-helix domain-containing protein [Bacteroidales bacterium]